jgi:hypothetical protein
VITTRRGLFGLLPALAARKGRKVTPEYPVVSNTALSVPAINSPNFNLQNPSASPSPSWAILQNGLAYFFGLTIEGGGTFTGPDYIINSSGEFFYDGTPAFGNLVYSNASSAGTDQFGNAYLQSSTTYESGIALQQIGNELITWFALTAAGPYTLTGSSIAFGISPGSVSIGGSLGSIGGTAANPTNIQTDSWHTMTLISGWSVGSGGYAQYKLEPNNRVSVRAANLVVGTVTAGTSIWTPPAGTVYVPVTTQRIQIIIENSTGAAVTETPRADVSGTGFAVENFPLNTTRVGFNDSYALD